MWNEACEFDVVNPDLALLRFEVKDKHHSDYSSQAVFPIPCIKTGFRSIQLKNAYNDELELSSLLVHVDIRAMFDEDDVIVNTTR